MFATGGKTDMNLTGLLKKARAKWEYMNRKQKGALYELRLKTWFLRQPPAFLVLGAQKAGTTSLADYLDQHPQLHMSRYMKEINYFSSISEKKNRDKYGKGMGWYRAFWDVHLNPFARQLNFEATPYYLYQPEAAERIARDLPNAQFIVLMRDPVERAISHYLMNRANGWEDLPMLQAFEREEQRMAEARASGDPFHANYYYFSYQGRGRYAEQLRRWFSLFPRERFLLLRSDHLQAEPQAVLRQVYHFLGVRQNFAAQDLAPRNVNREKAQIDPLARQYLAEVFAPHNQDLATLLGLDLTGWAGFEGANNQPDATRV